MHGEDRRPAAGHVERVACCTARLVEAVCCGLRVREIHTDLQPLEQLSIDIGTHRKTLVVRTDDVRVVVEIAQREIVVGLGRTARNRCDILLTERVVEHGIGERIVVAHAGMRIQTAVGTYEELTVGNEERIVVTQYAQQLLAGTQVGGCQVVAVVGPIGVTHTEPSKLVVLGLIGSHVVIGDSTGVDTPGTLERDAGAVLLTGAGGNHNHAVGGTRTVQRVRNGILRYGHRLDIGGVDVRQRTVERHAVDDDKCGVAGRDRTDTAHHDRSVATGLAGRADDLHTGYGAFQRLRNRRSLRVGDQALLNLRYRTDEVLLTLLTVSDDRNVVDSRSVVFEDDIDSSSAGYGHELRLIAQEREFQSSVALCRDLVMTVSDSGHTTCGPFYRNRCSDDRLSGLIGHCTGNPLTLSRGYEAP